MKITKTKEYDLNNMSPRRLRGFLSEHYNFHTRVHSRYAPDCAQHLICEDYFDFSERVKVYAKVSTSDEVINWYIDKIKELENERKV